MGACFNMILASVSSLAKIEIGVRGLMFLRDLSISSLIKFFIRKEFGFLSGKVMIVFIGCTISSTPIALSILDVMFQTGQTFGQW